MTPDDRVRHYIASTADLWGECSDETKEAAREVMRMLCEGDDEETTSVPD